MGNPHPDSRWTHPICAPCYLREEGGRTPVRLRHDPDTPIERCCWCNRETVTGIFYRADPSAVHP